MSGRTLRAVRFHGVGLPPRLEAVPYPEPGPGEVVVRVEACGVCGSDLHFLDGMPVPGGLPITLGHEPAGRVEALGPGVRNWSVGQPVAIHLGEGCGGCRVCRSGHPNSCPSLIAPGLHIDGAFAEAIRVPASCLVRIPDGVSFAAAALATDCVTTPYHALRCRARLEPGETVAVIGVGGLGGQAVRMAGLLGAGRVIAADRTRAALERARRAGASAVVQAEEPGELGTQLHALADGGADVVVECVGKPATVAAGVRALRPGGRLVIIGVGMAPPAIELPQALFCVMELSVFGSFGSHRRDLAEVLQLQAEGLLDIDASISHRLPLAAAPKALEMLRAQEGNPERIVIEPQH